MFAWVVGGGGRRHNQKNGGNRFTGGCMKGKSRDEKCFCWRKLKTKLVLLSLTNAAFLCNWNNDVGED